MQRLRDQLLPVPDSPEMSTVASEGATFPMSL